MTKRGTLKILITSLLVASTFLVACGKRNNNSNPTGNNGFALDAYGNPIIPGGGSGFIGAGQWQGTLTVQNPGIYREMIFQNGICNNGYMCSYVSNWMFLTINLSAEWLPGPANFSVRTYSNGYWSGGRNLRADAYANGNTGFQLIYTGGFGFGGGGGFGFGGGFGGWPGMNPGMGGVGNNQNQTIQIIATFVDASRQILNVQVLYRGSPVATGQLRGQLYSGGLCGGIGGANCFQNFGNGQFQGQSLGPNQPAIQ